MQATGNIVLVGFMGTGKTSVGRAVAARLGWTFLDMDVVIEQRAGKVISRIFTEEGEPHFRALERTLAQELASQSGRVIATGGGIVLNPDNIRDFTRTGLVVCLKAGPETILRRVEAETHRPLLDGGEKRERIVRLLASRGALYDAIPIQIDTDRLSVEDVADRIMEFYAQGGDRTGTPD